MECKLSDLYYGNKFQYHLYGYTYLIVSMNNIDCIYDPYGYIYVVNTSTGSMDQISLIDAEEIIVYKEV